MKKVHEIKISPVFFKDVSIGIKPFELRVNDRNYQVGDCLVLEEFNGKYTGNETIKIVTYMLIGGQYGIDKNWCVLGLRPIQEHEYQQFENNN